MPPAGSCQALVLNADYRPLSYFPLSVWSWQDAVKAVFLDRVAIISEYDTEVHSPSFSMRLPSVIALKDYIPNERAPAFTRFNVFLRDHFTCQYCGHRFPTHELTFDHVIPRTKGGRTNWLNVVTACSACNVRKAAKDLYKCGMRLMNAPRQPSAFELQANGRAFPPNFLHETWRDYLYWDSELQTA
ncbi:MAG TPA: HNH endonuclease [Alphaproteobacteria bacterium]|nr:HNH endonuclease [Alphaproteobacteria bacterium]